MDESLIARAAAAVRAAGLGWVVEAAPPVSDEAIAECEARLAVPLPASYRNLLRQHDEVTLGIDVTQYYRDDTSQ